MHLQNAMEQKFQGKKNFDLQGVDFCIQNVENFTRMHM
jgi:hypothetical protein